MINSKILKESALYSLSGMITQAINLITLVLLIRYLSKDDLGYYFYILEFIAIFAVLAENGYRSYYIRELSQTEDKISLLKELQFSQISIVFIILCLTLISSSFLTNDIWIIGIISLGTTLVNLFTPINAYIISEGNKKIIFYKDIFIAILRLVFFLYGFLNNVNIDYFLYFVYLQFLFLSIFWVYVKMKKFNFLFMISVDWSKSYKLIYNGFAFTLLVILNLLYNKIDILMLESMKGYTEVADYTSATKFLYPLMFFSSAFMISVFPKLSKYSKNEQMLMQIQNYSIKLIGMWGLLLSMVVWLVIDDVYIYLIGIEFHKSLLVYKVLLPYIPIVFMYGIVTNTIVAKHDTSFLVKINAGFLVLNIMLNLYFIKYYSSIGAAISTMFCEFLILLVVFYYGYKKYNFRYPNKMIFVIFCILIIYYISLYKGYI